MCVIVDGVPRSPRRAGVMARVKEMHAYTSVVNPKGIEDINITGTPVKKNCGKPLGQKGMNIQL